MAKLYFRYGAMNCGKTTALIQVAYNYEERGNKVIVIKSIVDTKGGDNLVSRIGLNRKADLLLGKEDTFTDEFLKKASDVDCILVDEAQFLSPHQVLELWKITKRDNIPVICYGLRSDFKSNSFPGSMRLMELADEIDELITICRCGKRAKFNARKINEEFIIDGEQVAIDQTDNISYESLCGKCYLEKFGDKIM